MKHPDINTVDLADIMYALSDPNRLEIVKRLSGGEVMTCGALNGDRPKSSMSHHFKILRSAGVLETQIEGKEHLNRLRLTELEERFPGLMAHVIKFL